MIHNGRTHGTLIKGNVVGAQVNYRNRQTDAVTEPYYLLDSEDCRLVDSEDNVLTVKR